MGLRRTLIWCEGIEKLKLLNLIYREDISAYIKNYNTESKKLNPYINPNLFIVFTYGPPSKPFARHSDQSFEGEKKDRKSCAESEEFGASSSLFFLSLIFFRFGQCLMASSQDLILASSREEEKNISQSVKDD